VVHRWLPPAAGTLVTPSWRSCVLPLTVVESTPEEHWRASYEMDMQLLSVRTRYQHIQVFDS
jgi:hypothetical protein